MMKAVLGSALGGLIAGLVVLAASAQGRAPEPAWASEEVSAYATNVNQRQAADASTPASSAVQCAPGEEAALQRTIVDGRELAQLTCVTRLTSPAAPAAVAYRTPASSEPDIVERPVVRTRTARAPVQRVVYQREEVKPKRSWQKSALVIGGAAGAGAGIGALAGGKKGALIGAAVGGGSGAIYEAIKRR